MNRSPDPLGILVIFLFLLSLTGTFLALAGAVLPGQLHHSPENAGLTVPPGNGEPDIIVPPHPHAPDIPGFRTFFPFCPSGQRGC